MDGGAAVSRNSLCLAVVLVVGAAFASAASPSAANAQNFTPAGDRIGNWKLGALAYTMGEPAEATISDLHNKVRLGSSLLPKLEPYADIRPWVALGPATPDGTVTGMGGILIDVPLGSFVFTPSIGLGTIPRPTREPDAAVEFRSQLELGYQFENNSRFSLGYSRIEGGSAADAGLPANNVFGLYYRLPFGALSGR